MVVAAENSVQSGSKKAETLLSMEGICKAFSGVTVLDDVHFILEPGQVHILAGENGAGKSTLIKILAGVHTDYEGGIFIQGQKRRFQGVQEAASCGISVIHQELSLVGPMTIAENIFLGREKSRFAFLSRSEMNQQAGRLLADMGLDVDPDQPVEQYPIGIQQMIEICKALAFDARIIVMDEPTSALTDPEVERLFGIIDQLKARGCGIIYISHKMEEIYRIADSITVLRDGKYIGTDTAENLEKDRLVEWMIGRQICEQLPRRKPQAGKIRLKVSDFTVPDQAGKPYPAVKNISFEIRAGEILGLAGLQGSGASELLNGLFGTYGTSVTGSVEVDAAPFIPGNCAKAIESGMALLTNDRKTSGLVLSMNIIENTTLASLKTFSPRGWMHPGKERKQTTQIAAALGLKAPSLDHLVTSLSGGNQQKVVISKWIQTGPKILLLDEPTRGVDVGAKHDIYELMNQWTSEGIAIVLITSEMPELLAMSDRILVMHRGSATAQMYIEDATQEKILAAAMGETVT